MAIFQVEFVVRDNEIDIQGVVNNANYLIYFAHARHLYAKHLGISFAKMAEDKQFLYLIRSEIDFKKPLRSEDKFIVTCELLPAKTYRFAFQQEIRKLPEHILIASSYNVCVCIDANNRNRPYIPAALENLLNTKAK